MNKKEKVRKIFLENLPVYKDGKNKGKADWKNTIGYDVSFVYDDIKGYISIVKYEKGKITIAYKNEIFWDKPISIGSLRECSLGYYLKKRTIEFKLEVGKSIDDYGRDMTITDREYRKDKNGKKKKWYKYHCNKCGWTEGWTTEHSLIKGVNCACCTNQVVVKGINDIATTAPWMVKYFVNKEDCHKYTKCSDKEALIKCPDCGRTKLIKVKSLYVYKSISCICSDGFSYPEKFVYEFLNQIKIKFNYQYLDDWTNNKKYDFYIPSLKTIIETHGEQHYKYTGRGRSLEEEQNNDKLKEQLARENGIKNYIILDCRESNIDWIKDKIIKSELSKLLDLSKIDWLKCGEFAINSNKIKEICEYWNQKEDWETANTLAEKFNIGKTTAKRYLNKGAKLGWCSYNGKEELKKTCSKNGKSTSKPIEIFKNNKSLGIFESCHELSRQSEELFGVKLDVSNMSNVCNGKLKQHKGFTFKYVENKDKYVA